MGSGATFSEKCNEEPVSGMPRVPLDGQRPLVSASPNYASVNLSSHELAASPTLVTGRPSKPKEEAQQPYSGKGGRHKSRFADRSSRIIQPRMA